MSCRYGAEVNEKCNLESVRAENARIRIANGVNTIFERKGDRIMAIPTPHISAKKEDIAKTVLMPGDPLRSEFIAKTFLKNPVLVNDVRGVHGYTGEYNGKKTKYNRQQKGYGRKHGIILQKPIPKQQSRRREQSYQPISATFKP